MTKNYSERIENALNDIQKIQTIFRQRYQKECLADKEIEEVLKIARLEHEEIQKYRAIGTIEEIEGLNFSSNQLRLVNLVEKYKEKLKEYEIIGTVEECQEARERQRAKKVKNRKLLRGFYNRPYSVRGDCPNCGSEGLLSTNTNYCNACGQKLDWSDTP